MRINNKHDKNHTLPDEKGRNGRTHCIQEVLDRLLR